MTTFRPCVAIPSHNHHRALPALLAVLRGHGLPVLIVDDGSDAEAAAAIARRHDPAGGVSVLRFAVNRGKGAAVIAAFEHAAAAGFSHVVQIDADGQHDLAALPALLAAARAHPAALVSGRPVYDATIPRARRIGRWITHLWVFVETLSLRISDSMCGFRVYPLAPTLALLAEERVGLRMQFDTEIMVRLFWRGTPPLMVPVAVTYPPDNSSNFDPWRDNLRISAMHTRLVTTLLLRLPSVLAHRPPPLDPPRHWAGVAERGAGWGLALTAWQLRHFGRRATLVLLAPALAYFFLTGRTQRAAARAYLARVGARPPGPFAPLRLMVDFAGRALDTVAAWAGMLPPAALEPADPAGLAALVADPRGAVLVVSHHGNVELARALADPVWRDRLTVLVHTRHAENFNRVLARFAPAAAARLVEIGAFGPDTVIALQQRIERGEWIAIAGDRVPVASHGRVGRVPFLGAPAAFPHGPWLLAALLDCPVHLLFCRRIAPGRWRLMLERMAERIELPRAGRAAALDALIAAYAARLEAECRAAPEQWYNFYDFWAEETTE
ncbi:MAG: hypothetical protein RLZZ501_285 [Pseudomonadota bacterium]